MNPPALRTAAAWTAKVLAGLLVLLASLAAVSDAGTAAGTGAVTGAGGAMPAGVLVEQAPAADAQVWASPVSPQGDVVTDPAVLPTGWALPLLPLLLARPAAAAVRRHRLAAGPLPGRGPPFALAS